MQRYKKKISQNIQRLDKFVLPKNFRGRGAVYVQAWWLIQASIFRCSPQVFYGFRVLILRAFGAKIGSSCIIRPTVKITYPWKVSIGDNSWIGDGVELYSLGKITIGNNSVISQGTYICAADHDYEKVDFPIRERPVTIGDQVWVGAKCFIGPGVSIADGVVLGAASTTFKDLPPNTVCVGSPARIIKERVRS